MIPKPLFETRSRDDPLQVDKRTRVFELNLR